VRYRVLGRTGLRVSELFFGGMSFHRRGDDLPEYAAMIDAAVDFELGFPGDFITGSENSPLVFGDRRITR
jgi:hypothetical protein